VANRLKVLKNLVAQNPKDSFSRYGLAMEHRNSGDLDAAAVEFRSLMELNPNWVRARELLRAAGRQAEIARFLRQS
jgi:cytochrome c-type biogenesis protein CcmH/NrfG